MAEIANRLTSNSHCQPEQDVLTGLCVCSIIDCLGECVQEGDPRRDSKFASIVHG